MPAASSGESRTRARIELSKGVFCPIRSLLFAVMSCPGGALPPQWGGDWIGNAPVAFGDSAEHAYINVWKDGQDYRALLIAVATAPRSPPFPP